VSSAHEPGSLIVQTHHSVHDKGALQGTLESLLSTVLSICSGCAVEVGVGANLSDAWHSRQTIQADKTFDHVASPAPAHLSSQSICPPTDAQLDVHGHVHEKSALFQQESHDTETCGKEACAASACFTTTTHSATLGSIVSLICSAGATQRDILRQDETMQYSALSSCTAASPRDTARPKRLNAYLQVMTCSDVQTSAQLI
jgi:hypothetical protein